MAKNTKTITLSIIGAVFVSLSAYGYSVYTNDSSLELAAPSYASTSQLADLNTDGSVNVFDLSILLSNWGSNSKPSDINLDGTVNVFDLSILLSNWGSNPVTPKPAPEWSGDYETGDLSQFVPGSWNFYPSPASASVIASSSVSPVGAGNYIGKYYAPSGVSSTSSSVRAESIISSEYNFNRGDDKWFYFSTYLGPDVPSSTSDWQSLAQWKNDGEGSPPISLIIDKGEFKIDGGYGYPGSNSPSSRQFQQTVAPATKSTWHNWLFHIYFSDDPSQGYMEAWHNGQPVSWNPYVQSPYPKVVSGSKFYPPGGTLYPGLSSYLKLGIYRSANIQQSSTYYHDNWRIGSSRESVDF